MSGYVYRSVWGWSWQQEEEGGPFVVRSPSGMVVAWARDWWVAAAWALEQRPAGVARG